MSIHQFGAMSIAATAVLVTSATLDYEIYSPDLFNGTLYLGGWRTAADIGPDQLYTSPANTDRPTPLVWNGPAPYDLYHLNDPSVVREADGTLAMFMTALPNLYGYSVEMQSRNVTGLATSVDDGATWTWQGIVIGHRNLGLVQHRLDGCEHRAGDADPDVEDGNGFNRPTYSLDSRLY